MVNIYHYLNNAVRKLTIKELNQFLQQPDGLVWVDMEDPQEAEEETILISLLDYHPLAIEDCQNGKEEEGHLPKVEDFDDYLFIIFNPVESVVVDDEGRKRMEIKTSQVSAFLSKKILVTHHHKPQRSINHAAQMVSKNPMMLGKGPDFLFHLIIDDIVDSYSPILDTLDSSIDAMEDEVFHSPTQQSMVEILNMKKNIMTVRRVAVYQREMLNRLSRGEFTLITEEETIYYRNVYDHLVRMSDLADSYRDMVAGLLDAYLSVTSNRLNQVMKVLTIISTIFLPLSFITGFFGMNFRVIPLAEMEWGIGIATLFMAAVAGFMLWVFKKNKWL
ncbi:MAG: magnesium and cobalt transport protein CorA [Chlorobiaceae bacterium]|nr:magnesium and cobalt transport protein CorA [Chlorobiaceae bacterium]